MTRPDPRKTAALSAALSGAVDLGALKARADAARTAAASPAAPSGGSPAPDNGSAPWIVDVTEASFQAVVEQSLQVPVVVLLGASYSPESQQLAASLTRFASTSGGSWILARVDLESAPRIGQAFGVQSVPTTVAVAAGQPIDAFAGPIDDAELSQWIARLLDALRDRLPGIRAGEARAGGPVEPEEIPEDPRIVAAEEAFERGDYVAAQGFYSEILASEPGNELAKEGLAQARFAERAEAVDPAVIAKADGAPEDVDAQLAAADAQVAGQMVEEAFSRLVETVRRVFGDDRDRVRQHLVGLFELFPADDPRVAAARRNLASALY
ncbi:tetratricopeptide repeat protein [Lentzea sp. NPDC055074]